MTKRIITIAGIALILLIAIALIIGGRPQISVTSAEARVSHARYVDKAGVERAGLPRSVVRESLPEAVSPAASLAVDSLEASLNQVPALLEAGAELEDLLTVHLLLDDLDRGAFNV